MGAGDGEVIGITKIVDNGPETDRFNLVLVAEGYQDIEMDQFASDAITFVLNLFFTPPFGTYRFAFNIFRLDVISTESGADDPMACAIDADPPTTGASPATYFDARFCTNNLRRLLTVDTNLVISEVGALLPQWNEILVLVNSPTIRGGSGGRIAVASTGGDWWRVGIHELGHAIFDLADEYEYRRGCGDDTDRDHYTGVEPPEVNITKNTDRATIKWGDLIDPSTPLPTTSNADCTQCDPQPSTVPTGTVGAFEGAYYYHCGVYRPEFNCIMRRTTAAGFCAVCQRRIRSVLEPYTPPYMPFRELEHKLEHMIPEHLRLETKAVLPPWILVAYLIINWRMKDLAKDLKVRPSREFYSTLAHHLSAYLVKDTMPPAEIASAILNLADDYMANRQMSLRAGDYIAIQNFIRKNL